MGFGVSLAGFDRDRRVSLAKFRVALDNVLVDVNAFEHLRIFTHGLLICK